MKCRECGAEMRLDDRDFISKVCYDNYWECPDCSFGCYEIDRYSIPLTEEWHTENNVQVKDTTIICCLK